jgi:hypothetical protein
VRDWLRTAAQRTDPPRVPLRFQVGDAACAGLSAPGYSPPIPRLRTY